MPTFNVEVDFSVYCGACGAGLCNQSDTADGGHHRERKVTVEPCKKCLDEARNEGDQAGYDRAQAEAN